MPQRSMFFLLLILFILQSCSPGIGDGRLHSAMDSKDNAAENTEQSTVDAELVPTLSIVTQNQPNSNSRKFEKSDEIIKNPQADLILGRLKFNSAKANYNASTGQFVVTGQLEILDENKSPFTSTQFTLSGKRQLTENTFVLADESSGFQNKESKNDVTRVGATVACLASTDQNRSNCQRAVIDIFVFHEGVFYTDQLELLPNDSRASFKFRTKTTPNSPETDQDVEDKIDDKAVLPNPPPQNNQSANDNDNEEKVSENEDTEDTTEPSVEGRYVGQAAVADLKQILGVDIPVRPATGSSSSKNKDANQSPKINEPESKKEKPLAPGFIVTASGDVRPIKQAIGSPSDGALRNATSVYIKQQTLGKDAFFRITDPKSQSHYSTYETAEMAARIAKFFNFNFNKFLYITSISRKFGGAFGSHKGHQNGTDVDIGYPSTDPKVLTPAVVSVRKNQKDTIYNESSFSVKETYQLFKFAFLQSDFKVERIFSDQKIITALCQYAKKNGELTGPDTEKVRRMFTKIDHISGHGKHFHLRMGCSIYDQPDCRTKIYFENPGCN